MIENSITERHGWDKICISSWDMISWNVYIQGRHFSVCILTLKISNPDPNWKGWVVANFHLTDSVFCWMASAILRNKLKDKIGTEVSYRVPCNSLLLQVDKSMGICCQFSTIPNTQGGPSNSSRAWQFMNLIPFAVSKSKSAVCSSSLWRVTVA